jgi:hypothetical protein
MPTIKIKGTESPGSPVVMEEPRMVIRDELEQEEGTTPLLRRAALEQSGARERPETGISVEKMGAGAVQAKCPYLAGRPPCGTHHLFPSGTNVCWADTGDNKPYRTVSRDTQATHCFNGPDGLRGCERYQRAIAAALPLPQFERPSESEAPRFERPQPRHRRSHRRQAGANARLWYHASWLIPLGLVVVLLVLLLR